MLKSTVRPRAFTLVEILIVVVILGILAAIVTPQFSSAAQDAATTSTYDQLIKIRRALGVYYVRNGNVFPSITAGNATWGELIGASSGYMREAPPNQYVPSTVSKIISIGSSADTAYQATYGWVYNPATGEVWAGSFDSNDQPLPKP